MIKNNLKIKKSTIIGISIIVIIIGTIIILQKDFNYSNIEESKKIYYINYSNHQLGFRENLTLAYETVDIKPNEEAIHEKIVKLSKIVRNDSISFRRPLEGVTLVFKDAEENNGWYILQNTEIINKLSFFYGGLNGIKLNFTTKEIQDYDNLEGTSSTPIIALVHPKFANETSISLDEDNNVIYINGGSTLQDFDLATTRFIMIFLDINNNMKSTN